MLASTGNLSTFFISIINRVLLRSQELDHYDDSEYATLVQLDYDQFSSLNTYEGAHYVAVF